jgi:hypothetical protein
MIPKLISWVFIKVHPKNYIIFSFQSLELQVAISHHFQSDLVKLISSILHKQARVNRVRRAQELRITEKEVSPNRLRTGMTSSTAPLLLFIQSSKV